MERMKRGSAPYNDGSATRCDMNNSILLTVKNVKPLINIDKLLNKKFLFGVERTAINVPDIDRLVKLLKSCANSAVANPSTNKSCLLTFGLHIS